jgi:hypothetical protein
MTDAINILMDQQPGGDAEARQRAAAGRGVAAAAEAAGAPAAAAVVVRCGDAEPDKEAG